MFKGMSEYNIEMLDVYSCFCTSLFLLLPNSIVCPIDEIASLLGSSRCWFLLWKEVVFERDYGLKTRKRESVRF